MHVHHAVQTFFRYASREKADCLLHFAYALTRLARDMYEGGRDGLTDPSWLRCMKELQHRVLRFLMALMKNDANRYPDAIFGRLILEPPRGFGASTAPARGV
jgi:hypothetical protein